MKLIELSRKGKNKGKYFAMVDDEDYDWLNQWSWAAHKKSNTVYAVRTDVDNPDRPFLKMHRVILGITDPNIYGDHIDHNGLNCQRYNLRIASPSQNSQNRLSTKYSRSKYLGVTTDNNGKNWKATISIDRKSTHLGRYLTEEIAAKVYDDAARKYYGEFACLNFK